MKMTMEQAIPEYKFALREDLKDRPEFLPTRSEPLATGWDVRCAEPEGIDIANFSYAKIRLGFRGFCPQNFWYELKPRSSTFAKKYLHALYGTIDETYDLELVFACQLIIKPSPLNALLGVDFSDSIKIEFGEKIGQIVPVRRVEMSVSSVSNEEFDRLCAERNAVRTGGFGSTGDK